MVVVDLIVSRHGQTDSNSKDLLQGCVIDDVLNEEGLCQAQQLAEYLKSENIDWVVASPLMRAVKTAQIVAKYHDGVDFTTDHRMKAMIWGVLDGKRIKECAQERAVVMEQWKSGDFGGKVTGGESLSDCQARIIDSFTDILKVSMRKNYTCIYVCTHGSLVRVILASLVDKSFVDMGKYRHTNCGFYHFQVDVNPAVLASKGVDGLVFRHVRKDVRDHLKA